MVNKAKKAIKRSLERLSDEEIERILEEHLKWTRSKGKEGEPANLEKKNLVGAN